MNKTPIFAVAGLVLLGAGYFLYTQQTETADPALNGAMATSTTAQPTIEEQIKSGTTPISGADHDAFFTILKSQMVARLGERLERPYWRMKMLQDLKLFFQEQFPDNWEEELMAFLRFAFPDMADDLIAKFHAMEEYEQWVSNLKGNMEFASMKERQQAMWDKRVALFGDDAYKIWEAAYKSEQYEEKLGQLAQATGTYQEKQQQYMDMMKEVFGPEVVAPEATHKDQKMMSFLELPNVQQDLRAMTREQQTTALRSLRTQMGLDDEALARWDTLDTQRAERRSSGDSYMQQREALASQYSGTELDAKVDALRVQIFGEEQATFISNEERSGYFRFKDPQQIGIN